MKALSRTMTYVPKAGFDVRELQGREAQYHDDSKPMGGAHKAKVEVTIPSL